MVKKLNYQNRLPFCSCIQATCVLIDVLQSCHHFCVVFIYQQTACNWLKIIVGIGMKKILQSDIVEIGLAIFSMLFGAGNLMYPLYVGIESADKTWWGMAGFIITAVCLPVAGFLGMILFNGSYKAFFDRIGHAPGIILTFGCMAVIGPVIGIPRITTLSHTMTAPFLPAPLNAITPLSSFLFAIAFFIVTFLATYRENKIVDILGKWISPLLLLSLSIIIIKGIMAPGTVHTTDATVWDTFSRNVIRGYETLDLLGAIFFSSIILTILKNTMKKNLEYNPRLLASIGLKASIIGVGLLAIVYVGMGLLGKYHGSVFQHTNPGEIFREVSFVVLGQNGAAIIAIAVLMACLSTSIALSAVVAEYMQSEIFQNSLGYIPSLLLTLLLCLPLSTAGLTQVVKLTGGVITYVGYPLLITLTLCNIAYKLFGIRIVKVPMLITLIISVLSYCK